MSGPTIGDPASMVGQYYDAEAVVLSSTDWVPTLTGKSFARGLFCSAAGGNPIVDCLGIGGSGGATSVTFTMVVGTVLQLAVTKVHKTGTTGTYVALY